MTGVAPVISAKPSRPLSSHNDSQAAGRSWEANDSIRTAWEAADTDMESGDEQVARVSREEEEEESRYDIRDKKLPPKKRRRIGTEKDMHTVYTSDEDEDDGPGSGGGRESLIVHANMEQSSEESDEDGIDVEEAEYDVGGNDERERAKSKRSYWLSKGVALS